MRKLICVLAMLAVVASVSAKKKKAETVAQAPVLANMLDSVSYSIGVSVGTDMKHQLTNLLDNKQNNKLIAETIYKLISGDTTVIFTKRQADSIASTYISAEMKKKAEAWKTNNINFLAKNSKEAGVVTTASGLQYRKIKDGNGKKPSVESTVKVHYEGKLIDDKVFDSSKQRNEPIEFKLSNVIKGWTEGLQLMDEGSEYILYIPYELGYGERPMGNIPAFSTLIFDVELLEVK